MYTYIQWKRARELKREGERVEGVRKIDMEREEGGRGGDRRRDWKEGERKEEIEEMEKKKIYLREKSEVLGERYREKRENCEKK